MEMKMMTTTTASLEAPAETNMQWDVFLRLLI